MTNSPIYIGFDGGGSTSRFLIRRADAKPEPYLFSLNLKYSDIGVAGSAKGFASCLKEILGEDSPRLRAMCISLSGASNGKLNDELAIELRKTQSLPLLIHIESDSSFTLHTAYPDNNSGLLLISGTGSVILSKEKNGKVTKIGGWGRLLGDEGSGYWLGLEALKHYAKATDGIEERGALFTSIRKKIHDEIGNDPSVLRSKLYHAELHPQDLAPLVFEAVTHDAAAKKILDDGIRHLMFALKALWKKVKVDCEPIVTLHGAIARQKYISEHIKTECKSLGLGCKIMDENKILERALLVAENLK